MMKKGHKKRCLTMDGQVFLTLSVLEVVAPQGPDLVLPADIPHSETDVLVFYRLNVEAWIHTRENKHNPKHPCY